MNKSEIAYLREMLAGRPRPTDIAGMRQRADAMGLENPIAPDVIVEATSAGGVKAEWTTTPNADANRAVLYTHGGGCVIGSLDSHRHAVAEIGRAASARMLALDYRLAPESPFPAQIDDCLAAYRHLLETGFRPQNLALAGDSAGGGLVIATLMAIRDEGLPRPACGWAISPWVDMESSGGSMITKAAEDPVVQKPLSEFMAKTYLQGADPRNPLAAPIYGDLKGLPPLLIQVGAAETLLDDSVRLASVAGAAHVPVTLEIWPDMVHIWHVYFRHLSAARKAIVQGGAFVRTAMDGNCPIPHGVD
jgi:epsilon-lactone hydrolase